MSVRAILTTAVRMQTALTQREVSPAPATLATLEMGSCVQVSTNCSHLHLLISSILPWLVRLADINECELEVPPCGSNANCSDTDGSFICTCRTGFEGNGFTCTGKAAMQISFQVYIMHVCNSYVVLSYRCFWVCQEFGWMRPECNLQQHVWKLWLHLQPRIHWKWIHMLRYTHPFKLRFCGMTALDLHFKYVDHAGCVLRMFTY